MSASCPPAAQQQALPGLGLLGISLPGSPRRPLLGPGHFVDSPQLALCSSKERVWADTACLTLGTWKVTGALRSPLGGACAGLLPPTVGCGVNACCSVGFANSEFYVARGLC